MCVGVCVCGYICVFYMLIGIWYNYFYGECKVVIFLYIHNYFRNI